MPAVDNHHQWTQICQNIPIPLHHSLWHAFSLQDPLMAWAPLSRKSSFPAVTPSFSTPAMPSAQKMPVPQPQEQRRRW